MGKKERQNWPLIYMKMKNLCPFINSAMGIIHSVGHNFDIVHAKRLNSLVFSPHTMPFIFFNVSCSYPLQLFKVSIAGT